MFTRQLGRSGIDVSALGLGCWAIGGPLWWDGRPVGWGEVDDAESIRAIQRALDLGVTLFDTADIYGAGHSEQILGRALQGRRDQVIIATKFGYTFDPDKRQITGADARPDYIRQACEGSLRRLATDYIDLYQFHLMDYELERVADVRDTLEDLVAEGKIRYYGWSYDHVAGNRIFAQGAHCTAVQHGLHLFEDNPPLLALCEELDLASINRSPLAGGLLTGKFTRDSQVPEDDVRRDWNEEWKIKSLAALQELHAQLRQDGRSLVQGALGWIWARSSRTIPIPGFKTVAQIEENIGATEFGPLRPEQMAEIQTILAASYGSTARSVS